MKTAFSQGVLFTAVTACDTEARKADLFLLITIISFQKPLSVIPEDLWAK